MNVTVEIPNTFRVLKQSKRIIKALETMPSIGPSAEICVTWETEAKTPRVVIDGEERADMLSIISNCL